MKSREEIINFSNKYNQEKNQILTLINDLARKMMEDSKAENPQDYLTEHSVRMETNQFEITFSFKSVSGL